MKFHIVQLPPLSLYAVNLNSQARVYVQKESTCIYEHIINGFKMSKAIN
jgi:hypothetical protein